MKIFSVLFLITQAIFSLFSKLEATGFSHESDEYIGYYHFNKHMPQNGAAIYFSWNKDPLPMLERTAGKQGDEVWCDCLRDEIPRAGVTHKISIKHINNRWRYISQAPAYEPQIGPFDEFIVYHNAEKNPPNEGQECYFIPIRGCPLKFAHEAISREHFGMYKEGEFYKYEGFPTQNYPLGRERPPLTKDQKVPGLIYWREIINEEDDLTTLNRETQNPLMYPLSEKDIAKGLLNPLDKARWMRDQELIKCIEKMGLYQASDVLYIKYSSAQEAYNHYRSYGRFGSIYAAIGLNDVNAVALMLTIGPSPKPTFANSQIYGDYYTTPSMSTVQRNKERIKKFLMHVSSIEIFPKEAAEIFLEAGAIEVHGLSGGYSRMYLEIKAGDSIDLIDKKRAMHALLRKYGYPC